MASAMAHPRIVATVHRRRELVKPGAVSHGPISTHISRNVWRLRNSRKQFLAIRVRPICESSGRGFDGQRMAEEARRSAGDAARAFGKKADQVLDDIKRKTVEFQEKNDVQGKAWRAAKTARLKFEELSYDFKKQLEKWDQQYRVTEKAQQAKDYATEQALNVDRQYGLRQKARNATQDFRLKLPTYQRQVTTFLETPLGKTVATVVLVWFFISGWALRIFFFSLWFLPFAGPFLIQSLSKAAVVQGACPNCGTPYVGGSKSSCNLSTVQGCSLATAARFFKRRFFQEREE